jgi:hypothetical protein
MSHTPPPPKDWVGDADEQRELFVQILTYYTIMQHLEDGEYMSVSKCRAKFETFKTTYTDKTCEHFKLLLTAWKTHYDVKSNTLKILEDRHLSYMLYGTYLKNVQPIAYINRYKHIYGYLKE